MIGPDRLARVTAGAVVPEQVVPYVCAVAGSRPRLIGSCVGFESEKQLVLLGYPLHDPLDIKGLKNAVDEALKSPGLERITVIGPSRPPQAPAKTEAIEDRYYALPVPTRPGQKLRNLLRRAGRDLIVDRGRDFGDQHAMLVRQYLDERLLEAGTRHIFRNLPEYLDASKTSLIVSARLMDGRLAAFAIGEFASLHTAFFMFCFRDRTLAPPGSADLVLSGLLEAAYERGHTRMNLGLGVNQGIRFFKLKWGAELFLPYVQVSWKPESGNLFTSLRKMVRR